MSRSLVNDVHSRLNETAVHSVVPIDSVESNRRGTRLRPRRRGRPVSIAGGRHAMGGQQFCSNGIVLDTRPLSRVLDDRRGTPRAGGGRGRNPMARTGRRACRDALGDSPEADRCGRSLHRGRRLGERPRAWARVRPVRRRHRAARDRRCRRCRPFVLTRRESRSLPSRLRRLWALRGHPLGDASPRPPPQARARRSAGARRRPSKRT